MKTSGGSRRHGRSLTICSKICYVDEMLTKVTQILLTTTKRLLNICKHLFKHITAYANKQKWYSNKYHFTKLNVAYSKNLLLPNRIKAYQE